MPYGDDDPFARDMALQEAEHRQRVQKLAPTVQGDVNALRALQARGWRLDGSADLDAIDGRIAKVAGVYSPMEVGSPVQELVRQARQAVRAERNRRDLENQRAIERQRDRIRNMVSAAKSFERALQLMGYAEEIEDRRELIPRTFAVVTAEDARAMDDARLRASENMEQRAANDCENGAGSYDHSADVLRKWGGAQGKRLANVLREVAAEQRADAAAHRHSLSVISAEVARRAEPTDAETIETLRARVAELEQAAASGTGEG